MIKEKLKVIIVFIFISFFLKSCISGKDKFYMEEEILPNGDVVIKICKDNVILCTVDFDKKKSIKCVSNQKTDVIYFKELVYQINNKTSLSDSTLYTLNYENIDVIVDKYRDKMKSRTIIQNILFTPRVNHYTSLLGNENGWFLSEYRSFDFRSGKIESEGLEYVKLLNDIDKIRFREGVLSGLNFEIIANHSTNSLLRGQFDKNFKSLGTVDTVKINNVFSIQYAPSKKDNDTIRFVIINKNLRDGMHKSFYYELPIVVN